MSKAKIVSLCVLVAIISALISGATVYMVRDHIYRQELQKIMLKYHDYS